MELFGRMEGGNKEEDKINQTKRKDKMITLKPQGVKLIVHPIETSNFKTDGGLEIVQLDLQEGEVLEVSDELKEIYKQGDIVLYAKGAGLGVMYQKKSCVFLSGEGNNKGDIIALVTK